MSAAADEVLHLERRGRVALLTVDRPGRLNAIGSDTVAGPVIGLVGA